MIRRLLVCWALLLGLAAWFEPVSVVDEYRLAPLRKALPAKVKEKWMDCGEVNAYYLPRTRELVMCNELKELPSGVLRFVYVHERAHAVIHQNEIPYTGSEEWAADELAALTLIEAGDAKDVLAVAQFHLKNNREENPGADHPGDLRRAAYLMCMAKQGAEGLSASFCYIDYHRIKKAWEKLLHGVEI